jgi:hypothetical protein
MSSSSSLLPLGALADAEPEETKPSVCNIVTSLIKLYSARGRITTSVLIEDVAPDKVLEVLLKGIRGILRRRVRIAILQKPRHLALHLAP